MLLSKITFNVIYCMIYVNIILFILIAIQCYKEKNEASFYEYLDDKISERIKLMNFLRKNQSKLPEL